MNCSLVHLPRRKRCFFLPGVALKHLPSRIWGVFLLGRRLVSHSAPEKIPFSARSRPGAPSAQDLGCFPAREAVGIQFCAGKDTFFCLGPPRSTFRAGKDAFFCPESPRSTFRAGFGVFFCPGGGWYAIPRRKRYLFLPGAASNHLLRRILGVFLPGRWVVSHSAPEKIPFSARSRLGTPSAPDLGHFPARREGGIWRVWSFLLNLLDNAIFGL